MIKEEDCEMYNWETYNQLEIPLNPSTLEEARRYIVLYGDNPPLLDLLKIKFKDDITEDK